MITKINMKSQMQRPNKNASKSIPSHLATHVSRCIIEYLIFIKNCDFEIDNLCSNNFNISQSWWLQREKLLQEHHQF